MAALSKNPDLGRSDAAASSEEVDFSTLITIVSSIYSWGSFLKFSTFNLSINERELSPIGEGSVYTTYSQKIKYRVRSSSEPNKFLERDDKVVFKNPGRLFNNDGSAVDQEKVREILTEIRVLSHPPLYFHENIATLLGVTWHCEQLELNPAVQPQLILEVFEWTLEDFLAEHEDLSFETRAKLDLDMVNGLEALHDCDFIHGDVNPKNVFVKRLPSIRAHVQTKGYTAQLANFSNSFVDDGVPRRLREGASGFASPEVMRGQEITDFKAVDIYSLGITIWRTTIPNFSITALAKDHAVPPFDLEILRSILSEMDETPEKLDSLENVLFPDLLRPIVSSSPKDRDLETLKTSILLYTKITAPSPLALETYSRNELELSRNTTIHINYQAFNHANGLVHDQIVSSLERIASNSNDMRNPRALYELGVCHISKFGDPNKLNVSLGLRSILQAAEKGEIAAKGYASRLLETCLESSDMSLEVLAPAKTQWLLEAATEGFESAYDEFTEDGTNMEKKMEVLRLRWKKGCQYSLKNEVEEFKEQIAAWLSNGDSLILRLNSSDDSLLHWAAELNLTEHLRFLLRYMPPHIDCRNISGNTPLMAACSTGQLDTSLLLIEFGADVNSKNHRGETVLHFIWRFVDEDAMQLLHELVKQEVDFDQKSFIPNELTEPWTSLKVAVEEDPLPLLPGKAIQRVAGRGRIGLLREFLNLKPLLESSDSFTLCSMIFWASVLSYPEIRNLLTQYCTDNKIDGTVTIDSSLCSPEDSAWGGKSRKRNSMGPVARGWLSGIGTGWATPEIFWRMCCHGKQWESRLQKTILSTSHNLKKPLCNFEHVLYFSCPMGHTAFTHTFLKLYIDGHTSATTNGEAKRGHSCIKHENPGKKWGGFDMEVGSNGPRTRVPLIERILFRNKRTLVQFAVILGNRELFSMLVNEFDANVARPWTDTSSASVLTSETPPRRRANSGKVYVNCYTLLALHSQDIWFAHEFRKLGIHIDHLSPAQGREIWLQRQMRMSPPVSSKPMISEYLPPLSHSLDMGFHRLTTFLLDLGADLNESVSFMGNVLDRVLSPLLITTNTVRFLFGQRGFYSKLDGTMGQIHSGLLPLRLFDQGNGRHARIKRGLNIIDSSLKETVRPANKVVLFEPNMQPFFFMDDRTCPLSTRLMENEYLLHPPQSEQANKHELSLKKVWGYLLREFRGTDVSSGGLHWTGMLPHRSRSLLSLAVTAPYTISETKLWYLATSYYWGSKETPHPFQCCRPKDTFNSCRVCVSDDPPPHCRMDSAIRLALEMYEETVSEHRPSLIEVFLWNDFDILPPTYAGTLSNIGYRHSFLYFVEIRILSSIFMLSLFLFLIIFPLLMVNLYIHFLVTNVIVCVFLPALVGFFHSLTQLIILWRHWCKSGNFLWPMIVGKKRYTGYSLRQVFRAFVGVFVKRSKRTEPDWVGLRTLS